MEAFMEVVKAWIILGRPAVDSSAMGEDKYVAEVEDVVVAGGGGGSAVTDEECLEADTRLSRALGA